MLDAWTAIAHHIKSDKDKCHLMMTCKEISKCQFYFDEFIFARKIIGISWFDHFRSVVVEDIVELPKSIYRLGFWHNYKKSIKNMIPLTVKRVFFDSGEGPIIEECLPTSVTHLTIGEGFKQPMKGFIPTSVTHLTFKSFIFFSIDGCIPDSVTHLTVGSSFDLSKVNNISSVKYLIFSGIISYESDINNPDSMIRIERFHKYYYELVEKYIPTTIENIVFDGLLLNDDIKYIKEKFKSCKPNIFFPDMPEKYIIW